MIKLNAHLSKKVPIPGANFSSQSYGAGLEVEVADTASAKMIQKKVRELYALLNTSVQEQLANGGTVLEKPEVEKPKAGNSGDGKTQAKAETPAKPEKAKQEVPAKQPARVSGQASAKMLNLVEKLVDERKEVIDQVDRDLFLALREFKEVKGAIDSLLNIPSPDGQNKARKRPAEKNVEIKSPDDPASDAQLNMLKKLLKQRGISGKEAEGVLAVETKGEASEQIKELLTVSV